MDWKNSRIDALLEQALVEDMAARDSTTNLTISGLGASAGQCLTVDASGSVTTTACGTGGAPFALAFSLRLRFK